MNVERIRTRAYFHHENRTGRMWWDPVMNWIQAEDEEALMNTRAGGSPFDATDVRRVSALRPDARVHKCLLSTPARIFADYASPELVISLAWSNFMSRVGGRSAGADPTYIIIAFRSPEPSSDTEATFRVMPNYFTYAEFVTVCLSVFFGKWFHLHGFVETNGHFCAPPPGDTSEFAGSSLPAFSSKERVDTATPLRLDALWPISTLLYNDTPATETTAFFTAGRFYLQALAMYNRSPDAAFVDLVTAGEILSSQFAFPDTALLDKNTLALLDRVRTTLGDADANQVRQRLLQLKRKYVLSLDSLLDASFFATTEAVHGIGRLDKADIQQLLGASYDLRSKYVHAGLDMASLVLALEGHGAERQLGEPVLDDKELKKIIARSPTPLGLERIIRYALLRFAETRLFGIA